MESSAKQTCLKLQTPIKSDPNITESIFVKGTWYPTHFDLFITNGHDAWTCHASEEEVKERASQWDQPVSEYVEVAEQYLGFQQPGSVYGFADAGNGHKRLSWTFEKEGTKLEWRWKCQPSPDCKKTTADILDFLLDANIRLSEEVVKKTQSFDRLKVEAQKCLAQSEKLSKEKEEFESEIYAKFVGVLNSKKAKLRDLRDKLSRQDTAKRIPKEEEEEEEEVDEESSDKTVSYDEEIDDFNSEEVANTEVGTSKDVPASKPRGRKRK